MAQSPDCVVLVTHGVGNQRRWDFLEEFQGGLLAFLNRRLRRQTQVGSRPAPAVAGLDRGFDILLQDRNLDPGRSSEIKSIRLREFHWADLDGDLAPTVANCLGLICWLLKKLFSARFSKLLPPAAGFFLALRLFLKAGLLFLFLYLVASLGLLMALLSAPFRGRYNLLAKWVGIIMEYLGDVRQLEDREVRRAVNQRLHRTINEVIALDRPRFLVLATHSLGNVFVCSQLRRQLNPAPLPMAWISLGSPLWVLPLIEKTYQPAQELDLDLELGWYNIYDPMDLLAGPIFNQALCNPDNQWFRRWFDPLRAHLAYLTDHRHLAKLWEVVAQGLRLQIPASSRPPVRAPLNRRPLALGPFLRPSPPDGLNVWTAHHHRGPHMASLCKDGEQVAVLQEEVTSQDQLTHLWRFGGLRPGTTYQIQFFWQDEVSKKWWRLSGRNRIRQALSKAPTSWDLTTPSPAGTSNLRIMFASCNHPRHVHWDGRNGQDFAAGLLQRIEHNPQERPDALFLVGDQIYADEWWQDQLYIPWTDPKNRKQAQVGVYNQGYQRFWHPLPWSELLRLAPTYMMWDDHDIRDGWGCNANDFRGDRFSPAAAEQFKAATEAFRLYQARGNPTSGSRDDFQFQADLGPVSLFVFDPRTHRNYRRPGEDHPYGEGQMDSLRRWLSEAGERAQVLLVVTSSPLVFIPSWRLNLVAYKLPPLFRWAERFLHLSAFDDDWRDQLPCRLNQAAKDGIVSELAKFLLKFRPNEKRVLVLSGDVHVGCYARIKIKGGRRIDLWTASPITNKPGWWMNRAAALAWPIRKAGKLEGKRLWARDFFSKSARNVVLLDIGPSPKPDLAPKVRGSLIYEAGHAIRTKTKVMG